MKQSDLEQKLWKMARACPPSDHVPYAFEKRVMAALRGHSIPDPITAWARLLWRSAAPCLAITILLGFYAVQDPAPTAPAASPATVQTDTAPNLEDTLITPIQEEVSLALAW